MAVAEEGPGDPGAMAGGAAVRAVAGTGTEAAAVADSVEAEADRGLEVPGGHKSRRP